MMIKALFLLSLIGVAGFLVPEQHLIPVQGATSRDWNPKSFWFYPWGRSRVHKGIDIFAAKNTPVIAPTNGLILFSGHVPAGGNVIYILGPKWRFHYFAHLNQINKTGGFVTATEMIGRVGATGNAQGKPAHLHYSIYSLFPRIRHYDSGVVSAWQRLFYINPEQFFNGI